MNNKNFAFYLNNQIARIDNILSVIDELNFLTDKTKLDVIKILAIDDKENLLLEQQLINNEI